MKNIFIIISLVLIISMEMATAQEKTDTIKKKNYNNYLGVAAGYTLGYGLSYRFQPNKFGVQVTFSPYKDARTTQYSGGLNFIYKIAETKSKDINFLAYEGNSLFYARNKYTDFDTKTKQMITWYNLSEIYNNGIGIGLEFYVLNGLVFDFMGGYAFYRNFTEYHFTGETGMLFKF